MSTHYLQKSKSCTIGLADVYAVSDARAHQIMCQQRWPETHGMPVCPKCGCQDVYAIQTRRQWRCKSKTCRHTFSVTSGTAFHARKKPLQDYLGAVLLYANAVKGVASLQLRRNLRLNPKTAFLWTHKIREAICRQHDSSLMDGIVEVDGAYVGGKPRQDKDRQVSDEAREKARKAKRCVLVARQRGGPGQGAIRTVTQVVTTESSQDITPFVRRVVREHAQIHTDEHAAYDNLNAWYDLFRVNHSQTFSGPNRECTNQAESYFLRFRRLAFGQVHRLNSRYLDLYAQEVAYREDTRRWPNGRIWADIMSKMMREPSTFWRGYQQGRKRKTSTAEDKDLTFDWVA